MKNSIFMNSQQSPFSEEECNIHFWKKSSNASLIGEGRSQVYLIEKEDKKYVIKDYYRGGKFRSLLKKNYLYTGLARVRPLLEWSLMLKLLEGGMQIARPIAVHVRRSGIFYQASLITEFIPNTDTFESYLLRGSLDTEIIQAIGKEIKRLHELSVTHPDINTKNILIDTSHRVFLIDFDKSKESQNTFRFNQDISRLIRSIQKLNLEGFEAIKFNIYKGYEGRSN